MYWRSGYTYEYGDYRDTVIPTHEELIKDLMDTLTEIEPDPVILFRIKLRAEIEPVTVLSVTAKVYRELRLK